MDERGRSGVSFVVPVFNGEPWIDEALRAILAQADGRPMEVVVVEDGSADRSPEIIGRHVAAGSVRLVVGPRRGAAAAVNAGVRVAVHPIICQVDQDVILEPGWMARLVDVLADPAIAAAQGYYFTDRKGTLWARIMGLDLEERYAQIAGTATDHVCTGNAAYRASALHAVGLFDESFGYGYDNDMSYRLARAGHRLYFCREARSLHRWRDRGAAYLRQQYGVGLGRLDLIAKHRDRAGGDAVSGLRMILHVPIMLAALLGLGLAAVLAAIGGPWQVPALSGAGLIGLLVVERAIAGIDATIRFRDPAALWFPVFHLLRDLAWIVALATWMAGRRRGGSRG